MHSHQRILDEAGYVTKAFSPFHFQVKKKGEKDIVNVWPTAQKVLKKFSPGPAPYYSDILKAVKLLLEAATPQHIQYLKDRNFRMYLIPRTKEEPLLWWYRRDPLGRLKEYAGKV